MLVKFPRAIGRYGPREAVVREVSEERAKRLLEQNQVTLAADPDPDTIGEAANESAIVAKLREIEARIDALEESRLTHAGAEEECLRATGVEKSQLTHSEAETTASMPPKRGRGRPRKYGHEIPEPEGDDDDD